MAIKISIVVLSSAIVPVLCETILGLTVFTRHGDRNSKHYAGYGLTELGFNQNYQVGSFYRNTYISSNSPKQILGISEDKFVNSQVWATAPDQKILANTATAFLQGLYPPLEGLDPEIATSTVNNGSEYTNPLNGYQYIMLHATDADSPNAIWIKGDDGCPAVTEASADFEQSQEFKDRDTATKEFYQSFWPQLGDVYDYEQSELGYSKAYDIFDLINVAQIHNSSASENVTAEELFQLRTLADSAEFGLNFNTSQPARSIHAQTLAGAIFNQLSQTITGKGKLKLSLLAGSYDTFIAFFGITKLTAADPNFFGLPVYASSMAFEIFTDADDVEDFPSSFDEIKVRFLFRNGSDAGTPLAAFPLFGQEELALSWTEFSKQMTEIAITQVEDWCNMCQSTESFCAAYDPTLSTGYVAPDSNSVASSSTSSGMSNAVAGVIGAMVTLGVLSIVFALLFLVRKRNISASRDRIVSVEKGSISSGDPGRA